MTFRGSILFFMQADVGKCWKTQVISEIFGYPSPIKKLIYGHVDLSPNDFLDFVADLIYSWLASSIRLLKKESPEAFLLLGS